MNIIPFFLLQCSYKIDKHNILHNFDNHLISMLALTSFEFDWFSRTLFHFCVITVFMVKIDDVFQFSNVPIVALSLIHI